MAGILLKLIGKSWCKGGLASPYMLCSARSSIYFMTHSQSQILLCHNKSGHFMRNVSTASSASECLVFEAMERNVGITAGLLTFWQLTVS
jgi:hypothetical protein